MAHLISSGYMNHGAVGSKTTAMMQTRNTRTAQIAACSPALVGLFFRLFSTNIFRLPIQ